MGSAGAAHGGARAADGHLPSDRASGLRAGRSLGSTRWTVVFRTTVHLRGLDSSRLPGASQEAPRSAMVLKVVKMVALATVLPRNLVFWWPQAFLKSLAPSQHHT